MEDNISMETVDSGASVDMSSSNEDTTSDDRSLDDFLVSSEGDDAETTEVTEDPAEEVVEDTAEEVTPDAPSAANEINPANIEEITQERIDQYFKSDDVYKALHENFVASDPNYQAAVTLLQDGNALQQYLMQNNETFANTQDLNVKADILHQAQNVLTQQIQSALVSNAEAYKTQVSDYIRVQQLDKYLNDNAANLTGVSKLTGDLYNTIVEKAGLPKNEQTQSQVGTAINNVFLALSREFNVHPSELIKVIENFGSKQNVESALNNLQNTSKLKIVAKERAKSITKGGTTNVNSRRDEFEDILEQYAI